MVQHLGPPYRYRFKNHGKDSVGQQQQHLSILTTRTACSFPFFSFGGQQLIRQYLSEFLIQLYRRYFSYPLPMEAEDYYVEKSSRQSESYNRLVEYLESHVYEKLSMERICRDNLMGRSYVLKIFREVGNTGVMALFSKMKIDTAKRMIREGQLNLTQIADKLEFSSIHYFSRQFKKECKMSPSEYSSSIRSLSEESGG